MSVGSWLQVVGVAVQAVGITLGAIGIGQTYGEHPDGVGFWRFYSEPIRMALADASRRVAARVGRILGRPGPHVSVGGSFLSAAATIRARGHVGFAPLDVSDQVAALCELERRVDDVNRRLGRDVGRVEAAVEAVGDSVGELSRDLDRTANELRTRDHEIAISGLRAAVSGLFLNGLGLLLIATGLVIG